MTVLYFDCFSGISGDMTLGALIDMGIDVELFQKELNKLDLTGYEISVQKKTQFGITGTDIEVILDKPNQNKARNIHSHPHHSRNLKDIELLINSSQLSEKIKSSSVEVFREIARAEARVHNTNMDEVHFHEVGAIDSIIDIVGTAICLDLLGVQTVFSSPLHDGYGFIECQHGMLPVPVPAVMEMLANSTIPIPVISENISTELLTPTGVGIIKCIAASFGNRPPMIIERVGYGMGKRETGRLNALRITLGTLYEENGPMEEIITLESNIDDMSPEIIGYLMERLLENQALDVFYSPIYMKKNRPAVLITVLGHLDNEENLARIILEESSTLGIRRTVVKRYCMDRDIVNVETELGMVRVKVASQGRIKKIAPEYEDCRKIAQQTGLPLQQIYQMVMHKADAQPNIVMAVKTHPQE